jgi:hypothetical protein
MRHTSYRFEFVEFVPKPLSEGVLYISIPYATASHLCFCGCGKKVVTPLSPTDWRLTFNGDTVSLDPSVGNWSYRCRSHYVLRTNRVIWMGQISEHEVRAIREKDARDKTRYYGNRSQAPSAPASSAMNLADDPASPAGTTRSSGGS